MELPAIHLVWFKRDLRLHDHAPLAAACEAGLPAVLFLCFEPSLMRSPEWDGRHGRFLLESALDLRARLEPHGLHLEIFHCEIAEALERLAAHFRIAGLYSHQETGSRQTYARDQAVAAWCRTRGIPWHEYGQDGVLRGLRRRDGWEAAWKRHMQAPPADPDLGRLRTLALPRHLQEALCPEPLPADWRMPHAMQPGGGRYALRYLHTFLSQRARSYTPHISKPEESRRSGSRLSPYLAWGCLSARQIWQATEAAKPASAFPRMLEHFQERLWWRSHYIQKLESAWHIDLEPINPGFEALGRSLDPPRFQAWAEGTTGYPMVDACMRCVLETGFLNFRMRAMLATVLTFTLWQPWQPGAAHLARAFLDFEPGIHYPQFQMQAGLSGYHPMRIYNPLTQAQRHNPQGTFIRKWVPELRLVPVPLLFEPWRMTALEQALYACRIGTDYPAPVVDFESATREAKARYWAVRQSEAVQRELPALWLRHCLPKNRVNYAAELQQHSS
jgi:deoxyribodipyrimidine photo-lyase